MRRFYLGSPRAYWLRDLDVPLFVSAPVLRAYRAIPVRGVDAPWALDSGAFSELATHGRWTTSAVQYAGEVRRWMHEIGRMDWASIRDYMCEPSVLGKTGLTVRQHQERTIDSYVELSSRAPEVPWLPVVQGWRLGDYLDHIGMYAARGVDLREMTVVGVGSVCRRQDGEGAIIVEAVADAGLAVHAFGFKAAGLRRVHRRVVSADSMAWSYRARRSPARPGCRHRACATCRLYAVDWYHRLIDSLPDAYRSDNS